ncbi:MAG: efflux RND transporter periplasmic adaptor subunit [Polaromonas sp.]
MSLKPRWALTLLIAISLVLIGYFVWKVQSSQVKTSGNVLTATAELSDIEYTVTATGTLQPKAYVDVGVQVSGQLKTLLVDIGDVVKEKQLLAEIDPSVYQAKVDGDNAQLLNLQAQLNDRLAQFELARLKLARQESLNNENATTVEMLQEAASTKQSAQAQVEAIRAQIKQTESVLRGDQASLGYTKIYAPIAGTVVSQAAKQGQTLNSNQLAPIVMRIANLATMTVQAQVSEADIYKLKPGMGVYFTTLGNSSQRHYGKLRQILPSPTTLNNVVLYDALFDVDNPNQALMTQMTAQVFFVVNSAKNAVVVPLTALHVSATIKTPKNSGNTGKSSKSQALGVDAISEFAGGKAQVTVLDGRGNFTERDVSVGVMNRVSAQIVSGLDAGEILAVGTSASGTAVKTAATQTRSALESGGGGGESGGGGGGGGGGPR